MLVNLPGGFHLRKEVVIVWAHMRNLWLS